MCCWMKFSTTNVTKIPWNFWKFSTPGFFKFLPFLTSGLFADSEIAPIRCPYMSLIATYRCHKIFSESFYEKLHASKGSWNFYISKCSIHTALVMGCISLLQCLGQLNLPPLRKTVRWVSAFSGVCWCERLADGWGTTSTATTHISRLWIGECPGEWTRG